MSVATKFSLCLLNLLIIHLSHADISNSSKDYVIGGISQLASPPYLWLDKCDKPVGATPHNIMKILTRLGLSASFAAPIQGVGSIDKMLNDIQSNNVDALLAMVKVPIEGIKYTDEPLTVLKSGIIKNKNNTTKFDSLESLSSYKGGIAFMRRSTLNPNITKLIEENKLDLITVSDLNGALALLHKGDLDYVLGSKYQAVLYARTLKKHNAFDFVFIPELSIRLYFGISEQSELINYLPSIDAELKNLSPEKMNYVEQSFLLQWLDKPDDCNTENTTP